jgi:hypothetical protein
MTEPFRFPEPGELQNDAGIPMSEKALCSLLAQAAMAMSAFPCAIPECTNCNAHRLIWWDTCNALGRDYRMALQKWLCEEGYPLPEAPWEDVDPDGTPHPRDLLTPEELRAWAQTVEDDE